MIKKFWKERAFYVFMTILVAIIIFFFSNISFSVGEKSGLNLAILYHIGVFFMFTFFLTLSLKGKDIDIRIILITILISLIYAISDEFHQLFVIGRFCSLRDVLIDLIGSLLAVLMIKIIETWKRF